MKAFISYSRSDKIIASFILDVLRGLTPEVFFDRVSILPGDDWKKAIRIGIEQSDVVYVLWCQHSSKSSEVLREFNYAKKLKKKIVPVFLDDTPIDESLGRFNGIQGTNIFDPGLHKTLVKLGKPSPPSYAGNGAQEENKVLGKGLHREMFEDIYRGRTQSQARNLANEIYKNLTGDDG